MGIYVSIRGWLECDKQQLAAIEQIITTHDDGFYTGGWSLPRKPFNWTCYLFYGGDLREQEVDWMLGQLREIAQIPASDADNDLVSGLFLASHEETGASEWQLRDGQVVVSPADDRYQYLDA